LEDGGCLDVAGNWRTGDGHILAMEPQECG